MIIMGQNKDIVIDTKHYCAYTTIDFKTSASIVALNAMSEARTLLGDYPDIETAKSALKDLSIALSDHTIEEYSMR